MNRVFAALAFGPLLLWAVCAGAVTYLVEVHGCVVHEGFANPCQVAGFEVGELAYSMGVFAAWGLLIALPFCLGSGLLWAIVALVAQLIRRRD